MDGGASASDWMETPVYTVGGEADLDQVQRELEAHGVSALVVVDGHGEPVGLISRKDLIRCAVGGAGAPPSATLIYPDMRASEVMTGRVMSVGPEAAIEEAARLMAAQTVHRVFVARDEQLLGVVSTREMMEVVADRLVDTPLCDAMSRPVVTVDAAEPIEVALQRIIAHDKQALVVTDHRWPVGALSLSDALVAKHWPGHLPVELWMSRRTLSLPATIPLHRAATHALALGLRHILVMDGDGLAGIVTGMDFTRTVAGLPR